MLFKMAALFVIAASTKMETTGSKVQWIYESGPNKGYVCALMEKDGKNFDVYVPSVSNFSATPAIVAPSAVPWQHFTTRVSAETAVKEYCK